LIFLFTDKRRSEIMADDITYDYDGKRFKGGEMPAKTHVCVQFFGPEFHKGKTVYGFKSEAAFREWVKPTAFGPQVLDKMARIARARKEYDSGDHNAAKARHVEVAKRLKRELQTLAARTGLDVSSRELFLRASSKSPAMEPPIFGSGICFSGLRFTGSMMAPPVALPDYRWIPLGSGNWNDRPRSIRASLAVFYQHINFRGCSAWMIGDFPNLGFLGMCGATVFVAGSSSSWDRQISSSHC
jgi:hypothetical protein